MINKRHLVKLPDPGSVDFMWKDQALKLIRDLAAPCKGSHKIRELKDNLRDIRAITAIALLIATEFFK